MTDTAHPGRDLRILIADDFEVIRTGLDILLRRELQCAACLQAADGRAAARLAESEQPHVALVDLGLPLLNGVDLMHQIKRVSPGTEILVLTGHASPERIRPAFEAGAKSFLFKMEASQHVAPAVLALAEHRFFITPAVHEALYGRAPVGEAEVEKQKKLLSSREREILQLVVEGRSNKELAELLGISVKTVETHRATIMRKLKLKSLSHLVRYAVRHQIVDA